MPLSLGSRSRHTAHGVLATLLLALTPLLAACGGAGQARAASASTTTTRPAASAQPLQTAPTATAMPTPLTGLAAISAPTQGAQASWRRANLPSGYGMQFHGAALAVSLWHGSVAYSCSPPPSGALHVVKTTDGGATWGRMTDVPGSWDGCDVAVDANEPQTVVVENTYLGQWAASRDGGVTWHAITQEPQSGIAQLASAQGHTYALIGSSKGERLMVSDDGLVTWRDISAAIQGTRLNAFWVNPTTGALLVTADAPVTYPPTNSMPLLWSSTDGGAHWASVSIPVRDLTTFAVEPPQGAAPWTLCVGFDSGASFACSHDSGAHWAAIPDLSNTQSYHYGLVAVASDGAALAYTWTTAGTGTAQTLYRLPVGASRWQSLGATPADAMGGMGFYPTENGPGYLWAFTAESDGAGASPDPTAIYSATYPY